MNTGAKLVVLQSTITCSIISSMLRSLYITLRKEYNPTELVGRLHVYKIRAVKVSNNPSPSL